MNPDPFKAFEDFLNTVPRVGLSNLAHDDDASDADSDAGSGK
jgi:hypothetical protein